MSREMARKVDVFCGPQEDSPERAHGKFDSAHENVEECAWMWFARSVLTCSVPVGTRLTPRVFFYRVC